MTTLLATRPAVQREEYPATLLDLLSDEPSLEDVLSRAWKNLAEHRAVACPVCDAEMTPEYGVHARPHGGSCGGCGSSLR